jgi:predicted RNase H-like nuclease (RuvC/YqgF family)
MNSIDGNAKVYDIHDMISFTKSIINDSTERLHALLCDGIEFEKQKEQMQQTITELKEYKRALRKNVAKLMCENEQIKCDYEKQLKQKDSKIAYLNDSVTGLETLVSEKSVEIKTLKQELDSYEIISESSEEEYGILNEIEFNDEEYIEEMQRTISCNIKCILLNVVILSVYLGTLYLVILLLHNGVIYPLGFNVSTTI